MLGAIATIAGNLFGTKKAGERIVEGIASAADSLVYTDQEKAEDAAEASSEGMKVYMAWLESTIGSRLARRFIAMGITGMWLSEQGVGVLMQLAAVFASNPVTIEKLTKGSDLLFQHSAENNSLVGVVLLFYFGGPAAIDGAKALIEKWSSRNVPG